MKAVIYRRGQGLAFVQDREKPVPGRGQVLVRVSAAAINPVDYKLPALLLHGRGAGLDFSGVVEAAGPGAEGFQKGEPVFGNATGTLAEYVCCDVEKMARKPGGWTHAEAAALPTAYLTGYQALHGHGFTKGSSLLVIGASGGCGTAGVHLGAAMGAAELAGICSARNAELVLAAGATQAVDYNTQDPLALFGPGHFDFVYDTATGSGAGEQYGRISRRLLKAPDPRNGTGVYISINGGPVAWGRALLGLQSAESRLIRTRHSGADLESILALASEGDGFRPVIDSRLPFTPEAVEKGFAHLRSRRARGKIVFEL